MLRAQGGGQGPYGQETGERWPEAGQGSEIEAFESSYARLDGRRRRPGRSPSPESDRPTKARSRLAALLAQGPAGHWFCECPNFLNGLRCGGGVGDWQQAPTNRLRPQIGFAESPLFLAEPNCSPATRCREQSVEAVPLLPTSG